MLGNYKTTDIVFSGKTEQNSGVISYIRALYPTNDTLVTPNELLNFDCYLSSITYSKVLIWSTKIWKIFYKITHNKIGSWWAK